MYLKRESYVEVRHQGCLYSYFHVDGDDNFNNGKVGKR